MPLTAFSSSREMELDVEQLLTQLALETGFPAPVKGEALPEVWKAHISTDLECPSCFSTGAEMVRAGRSKTDGHVVRQAYFRFSQGNDSRGHHPFCDFSGNVPAGFIPENLVQFSTPKDGVSRAVRELVCKGIGLGVFGQWDIRAMREWFFKQKVDSRFTVTLDPRLPAWLESFQRNRAWHYSEGLEGLTLTEEVLRVPGFDFQGAASRELTRRYRAVAQALSDRRTFVIADLGRIGKLADDYQGQPVFDPSVLRPQYERTLALAAFICSNHEPLIRSIKTYAPLASLKNPKYLMAFAALLLFISDWDLDAAVGRFAQIATSKEQVDESLGNVMGLNPFHDFSTWAGLKALQEHPHLRAFEVPSVGVKEEMDAWIAASKKTAGL
ncbi:hypothetical protein GIV19_19740 [Pseudomonas syringae]|uniref:hypothetical protein n=1 Tax=Pseudomonas syringae TaxID=317 RepID=UPI001F2D943A|nr:hypothetical protein [Pseudomonas syringae]MCF5709497.1 hypothetical protein [Pseudomonas syringae]